MDFYLLVIALALQLQAADVVVISLGEVVCKLGAGLPSTGSAIHVGICRFPRRVDWAGLWRVMGVANALRW